MDVTKVFCEVDDFCQNFELTFTNNLLGDVSFRRRRRLPSISASEMITILILFHDANGFRTFKGFYTYIQTYRKSEFPLVPSYSRFIQLLPRIYPLMNSFLNTRKAQCTGISFIDATSIRVCHNKRIERNKVFRGLAKRGKTTMGWFYGFKLHLIINHLGELIGINITPGNTDDREPVMKMTNGLFGKMFGDKGYISKELFEELRQKGVFFFTTLKKNMKPKTIRLVDKILLRKRSIIETVNDQLKNIAHIEHSRHRNPFNAFIHIVAALIAYTYKMKKPTINLNDKDIKHMNDVLKQNHVMIA